MRLNITVEGQTEETFVRAVLAPYLGRYGVFAVARRVLTGTGCSPFDRGRRYEFRGGMQDYAKPKRDIALWMRQERGCDVRFSTMFDLYGLPQDWPGRLPSNERANVHDIVARLENAFAEEIGDDRLIPYIQVHEFEALLLAEPRGLLEPHPAAEKAVCEIADVVEQCGGPELVNDGPETHPSRRLQALIAGYNKTASGPAAAIAIGIDRMREKCPHFREWVDRLASLGEQPSQLTDN